MRPFRRHAVTGLVVTSALATLAAPAGAADAVPGRLIAGFRSGTSAQRVTQLVEQAGGRATRRLPRIDAAVVRPRGGAGTSGLRKRLRRLPGVRYVEPDFYLRSSKVPDDPFYLRQYALLTGG